MSVNMTVNYVLDGDLLNRLDKLWEHYRAQGYEFSREDLFAAFMALGSNHRINKIFLFEEYRAGLITYDEMIAKETEKNWKGVKKEDEG